MALAFEVEIVPSLGMTRQEKSTNICSTGFQGDMEFLRKNRMAHFAFLISHW